MKNVTDIILKLNPLKWIIMFGIFIIKMVLWLFGRKEANIINNNRRYALDECINSVYNEENGLKTNCNEEIVNNNLYKEYKEIIEAIGRRNNDEIYLSRKYNTVKYIKIKIKGFYLYIDRTIDFLIDNIFSESISLKNRNMLKISIFCILLGYALSFDMLKMIKELWIYVSHIVLYTVINYPEIINFIKILIAKIIEFKIISRFILLFDIIANTIKLIGIALFFIALLKLFYRK